MITRPSCLMCVLVDCIAPPFFGSSLRLLDAPRLKKSSPLDQLPHPLRAVVEDLVEQPPDDDAVDERRERSTGDEVADVVEHLGLVTEWGEPMRVLPDPVRASELDVGEGTRRLPVRD